MAAKKLERRWNTKGNKIICQRGIVAIVPMPQDGGLFSAMDNLELLALAPELLGALKDLLETDELWHGLVNSHMAKARSRARRVIRAIEGKSEKP